MTRINWPEYLRETPVERAESLMAAQRSPRSTKSERRPDRYRGIGTLIPVEGRPLFFDDQVLLRILIFVTNGMAKTEKNLNKFCLTARLPIDSIIPSQTGFVLSGKSLHRRFYEACERYGVAPKSVISFAKTHKTLAPHSQEVSMHRAIEALGCKISPRHSERARRLLAKMLIGPTSTQQ